MTELKVLIIEDNESDALLSVRHLEKGGYKIHYQRVETAEQIKQALTEKSWDIVFSDYQLPGLNAPEALTIFQTFNLQIPFILISGAIGEESAVAIIKLGAHDYVMKNHLQKLSDVVKNELEVAEKRKEYEIIRNQQEKLLSQAKLSAFGEMASNFFKSNLEHLLFIHSIKQSQLARETGISKQTISDWLNKDSIINIQQALKLTKYFKITVEDLFYCNLKMKSDDAIQMDLEYLKKIQTPLCIFGIDSEFTYANQELCNLLGFSEYEMNSRIFSDIIHPEDINRALINRQRMKEESIVYGTQDIRFITAENSFMWTNCVYVKCLKDQKVFCFVYPVKYAKREELVIEKISLKDTALKFLSQIHNTTHFKKLHFIDTIDPDHCIGIDENIYKILLRSLFYQFQFIEFANDKKDVVLKSRIEENKIVLSATIKCAINTKKLDLSRVKKIANMAGADADDNCAADLYSLYISFQKV